MTHQLRRISTDPNSTMQIRVDLPDVEGGGIQGLNFGPAGSDTDTAHVSAHVAGVIMGDHGLAPHFECSPPIGGTTDVDAVVKKQRKAALEPKPDGN
jgi:hypothetical protein